MVAAWGVALIAGMSAMMRYEFTAGAPTAGPREWPSGASIPRRPGRATLILFAHPRCPCTRASLSEFAAALHESASTPDAFVVFFEPERSDESWDGGGNRRDSASIPNVRVLRDPGGTEAGRFNAVTSGHVMLFGADGRLLFDGGITAGRGAVGDNAGRRALVNALGGLPAEARPTPVYGCELTTPEACRMCAGKEVP